MTTDIIQLSKQVAEVLGVPDRRFVYHEWLYLAEDAGRCAEIAADRRISLIQSQLTEDITSSWEIDNLSGICKTISVSPADHNNERIKAYCVAVCKAVIEQAKESN